MPQQQRLLDIESFRAGAARGRPPEGQLFKLQTTEPQQVGDKTSRTRRFVFSDATVDHSGDSIDPKGWDLGVFKLNPVALWSHMSWEPPIGKASNVAVRGDKLVGDIEFVAADVYPFAGTIFELVQGGFLKAVSVGFLPKKWEWSSDKNRPNGIDFKQQRLLEISICPVPCNPAALSEARSLGIDTRPLVEWAEKVLDSGENLSMPRRDIEALRRRAAEHGSGRVMNDCIDDLNRSIADNRTTMKTLKALLPAPSAADQPTSDPDDVTFDTDLVERAIGHVREAVGRKGQAISHLRQALAGASDDANEPDGAVTPRATTPAARLAEVRRLLSTPRTQSRAERIAEAAAVRRSLGRLIR